MYWRKRLIFFLTCCGWSQRVKVVECQAVSLGNTEILGWVSDCSSEYSSS